MAIKSKKISASAASAKAAAKRVEAALRKVNTAAEPVADSLLTRLVASPYTFVIVCVALLVGFAAWVYFG